MIHSTGQVWRFSVHYPNANRVFLVRDRTDAPSCWMEMQRTADDQWTLIDTLSPGFYRVRYFAMEGNTYFNCGDADLQATPISAAAADELSLGIAQPA